MGQPFRRSLLRLFASGVDIPRQGGDFKKTDGARGNIHPGEYSKHYEPGTYTVDSFILVPPKTAYQVKEHPGKISFRAGGTYSFGFNTRYEYQWVEGTPPVDP